MIYVFDVDGTLTPSRQPMNEEFKKFFIDFIDKNDVYLVTGSDYPKVVEQVGSDIAEWVKGVFCCAYNHYLVEGVTVYANEFHLTEPIRSFLERMLIECEFPNKLGRNHIEERQGSANFSIVGRNCSLKQREEYKKWDSETHEREKIAELINLLFPQIECAIAGETGMDIYARGFNKGQIVNHIGDDFIFFGDKCEPGGNDYPLAMLAPVYYNVKDWTETWRRLKTYFTDSNNPQKLNYWLNFG